MYRGSVRRVADLFRLDREVIQLPFSELLARAALPRFVADAEIQVAPPRGRMAPPVSWSIMNRAHGPAEVGRSTSAGMPGGYTFLSVAIVAPGVTGTFRLPNGPPGLG